MQQLRAKEEKISLHLYHRVAHLIPGRRQVAAPEKLPDARLSWSRAVRHQHMKVAHKVLQQEHCMKCARPQNLKTSRQVL